MTNKKRITSTTCRIDQVYFCLLSLLFLLTCILCVYLIIAIGLCSVHTEMISADETVHFAAFLIGLYFNFPNRFILFRLCNYHKAFQFHMSKTVP